MEKDKKSIKDTFAWSCLELLVVPIILTGLVFYLNESVARRERMREYLAGIADLTSKATKTTEKKETKLRDNKPLQSLARAQTLIVLRESDSKAKREIIEFLANSDLQYQISLEKADLHDVDLSGLYIRDADLWRANLKGANLDNALLLGVDLRNAILDNASLYNIQYDHCTELDAALKSRINALGWKKVPRDDACQDRSKRDAP
ncbi:MAG: pentapeptide repeat-containing protein [Oscillatoriales cyanobacterium SM2_1_8]|nr:pentapeptide repeat-containing protein [Oscillatoriales cyanobacterium SM2_1_8]